MTNWWVVLAIGAGVGFLAGLFGKGGSALATPLLHAAGVPAFVAVATPLPATIPSTLAASVPYWRAHFVDRQVLRWTVGFGLPATLVGALASRWVGGDELVLFTDVLLVGIGVRTLARPHGAGAAPDPETAPTSAPEGSTGTAVAVRTRPVALTADRRARLATAGLVVGLVSGLLANSGGFLLVPLYLTVLRLPIKSAFASSLVVSAALAVPGTAVHVALGHVDWRVLLVFGAASVPLANLGARVALATDAVRLERLYGAGLAVFGTALLAISL